MNERLNGHAQMDANAAVTIAASQAARQVTSEALAANAAFDTGENLHAEANALNRQIDQGAVQAEKIDAIEARRTSPEVQAMNEAADLEIFGSRGRTQGYVDDAGKPLAKPIEGVVDKIRGLSKVEEIRQNPRYGTKESDREAAAQAYKAGQGERDVRAKGYVESIEELQAEGFELSQAKLIHDLEAETGAKQQELFEKLVDKAAGGRQLSPEENQKIKSEAVDRVLTRTIRDGDDPGMLKRIIKQEGLFDRSELDKFRYKRGNAKNGERKEFTFYREQSMADYKNRKDMGNRIALVDELNAKYMDRHQKAAMKAGAEADAAARREEEAKTAKLKIPDNPTKRNLRERVQDMMAGVAFAVLNPREYFGDKERGDGRKAVAGVVGALALAGVAYLELKGVSSGGSHGSEATMIPPVKPQHHEAVQNAQVVVQNGTGGIAAPVSHEQVQQSVNGGITAPAPQEHVQNSVSGGTTVPGVHNQSVTELNPGQNPWSVSEHRLEALGNNHPSVAQIEHYDQAMANANPDVYTYGGDSSESIPAGTVLKLPK